MPPAAGIARQKRRRTGIGLFDLYLLRGVAGPFMAVLLAVGVAMMLERALRLIHELAATGADIGYFFPLLVQLVPYYLTLAIPASFLVALVLLVSRLDERLELEAMLASGVSLSRIAAPLVAVGVVLAGFALVAGGWLEPLGRYGFRSLRIEAVNAGRIGRLQPRAIYQPGERLAVTFDRRGPDGAVRGIFLWQQLEDGTELTLTGGSARIGFVPGERLFGIDFGPGHYVAERPGEAPDLVRFGRFGFREPLQLRDASWARGWDQKELTLPELVERASDPANVLPRRALEAEFYSRIARAATIPLLPLLVLPLVFATKKGRRGLGILLSGMLLALAHHALNFAKGFAFGGGAEPALIIPGTAGLFALLVIVLFAWGRHLPSHSPIHAVLEPAGRGFARLAPKARALPNLRGRTVATYLAWELGKWTLLALVAAVALLQMVDLFDRSEAFAERGMGAGDAAYYAWLRLAPIAQQAVPVAVLAGAMATFAGLARRREMTAIRGAGISQWRILLMAAPLPVLLALTMFALAEWATPASQVRFAAWWAATEPAGEAEPPAPRWFRIGGDIVRADAASADGRRLAGVRIFRRGPDGLLDRRMIAARALRQGSGWVLEQVAISRFEDSAAAVDRVERLDWPARLAPADVAAFFAAPPAMSAAAARRSLSAEAPASRARSLFATRLHRAAAEPLAPLVMLLLALPIAFLAPRTSRGWPAWAYAAGGGLLYLVCDGVFTTAAQVGYLPAAAGAWAAPALFGLTALTVLVYAER